MAPRRTHERTRRPGRGVSFDQAGEDQADGLASGLASGLVTGLEVSGLVTTGGVDSRPGAVLLAAVEQAPTARRGGKDEQGEQGPHMASSFGVHANGRGAKGALSASATAERVAGRLRMTVAALPGGGRRHRADRARRLRDGVVAGRLRLAVIAALAEHLAVDRLVAVGHAAGREPVDDRCADRLAVELVDPVDQERQLGDVVAEEAVDAVADDLASSAPTRRAMTGVPQASASIATRPNGSGHEPGISDRVGLGEQRVAVRLVELAEELDGRRRPPRGPA